MPLIVRPTTLLFVLALALSTGCGGSSPVATLTQTADPVQVNGEAVQAAPASPRPLNAGDLVEVRAGGMARIAYPDGSRFLLLPDGQEPGRLRVAARSGQTGRVLVELVRGAVAFMVPEDRAVRDRYDVRAARTITSIDGTEGRIVTSDTGDSIALERGEVSVRATEGNATARVGAMQQAVLGTGAPAFVVSSYDAMAASEERFKDADKKSDKTHHGF